jgi:DNA-binding transcriptional regulator YdaS (Cro superfamily)
MKTNIYKSLVEHFGGQAKAAKALNLTQPNMSALINGRWGMSPIVAIRTERVTNGEFKAVDLCPSLRDELS